MKCLLFLVLLVCTFLNVFAQVPQAPVIFKGEGFVHVTLAHVKGAEFYKIDIATDSLFKRMLPGLENFGGPGNSLTNDPYFCNPTASSDVAGIQARFTGQIIDTILRFYFDIPLKNDVYVRLRAINSIGASVNSNTLMFALPRTPISHYTMIARRLKSNWGYIPASELKPGITYSLSIYRSTYDKIYNGWISACYLSIQDPKNTPIFRQAETIKTITQQDTIFPLNIANQWYSLVIREQNTQDTLPYYVILPSLSPTMDNAVTSVENATIYSLRDDFQTLPDSSILYLLQRQILRNREVDTSITHQNIDSVLTSMIQGGVPLEKVWFQESRFICNCNNLSDRPDVSVPISFAVKLHRSDDRIKNFGAWERVKNIVWATSPASVPRKYVFRQTMVSVRDDRNTEFSCSLAPNPSSEQVTIRYTLPEASTVQVEVLDVLGQTIVRHEEEYQTMGEHSRSFALHNLPNGVYFLRLHCFSSNGHAIQKTITFTHF